MAPGFTVKELKSRLDDNELDMSMLELSTVPVKEMAQIKQATVINLSVNLLQTLSVDFAPSLSHIVQLDLSENQIRLLPDNFGDLRSLVHLDLYKNQLETLPVSMAKLTKLKWLDVKDNPLESDIHRVVGDCIDEKQCKAAATKLVTHFKKLEGDLEREKQKRLAREREQESLRKAAEESEKREQQLAKKREKERRKQEQAKNELTKKRNQDKSAKSNESLSNGTKVKDPRSPRRSDQSPPVGCLRTCAAAICRLFIYALLGCVLTVLAFGGVFYHNCTSAEKWVPKSEPFCNDLHTWSISFQMPPNTQQHARQFLDGFSEMSFEKMEAVKKYDYAAKWERTKQTVLTYTRWIEKRCREWFAQAKQWMETKGIPLFREYTANAKVFAIWLWDQCAKLLKWTSETAVDMFNNSDKYVEKAKHWWNNLK